MPMKLRNYNKKQPILIFAKNNVLIFLIPNYREPKISEKITSEYFGNRVLIFFRKFDYSESSVHKR